MKKIILSISILLTLFSCNYIIEYSPYQVNVDKSDKNQNKKNIIRIEKLDKGEFKSFKIALFGDTHTYYDDFQDIVKELNKRDDFDFIINTGDITLSGINREFKWYSDIINKLQKPVITIIGNHDYLSNGQYVYKQMYGPTNFYFEYNNCKFVIFDDIIWEKGVQDPDFEYFNDMLKNDKNYNHVIPISHIQPWDEQFSYGNEMAFNYILVNNNVRYSFHGHTHNFAIKQPYKGILGDVTYITTEAANDRGYLIVTIQENDILIEKVNF
jgi:predicted phosphodiesterase